MRPSTPRKTNRKRTEAPKDVWNCPLGRHLASLYRIQYLTCNQKQVWHSYLNSGRLGPRKHLWPHIAQVRLVWELPNLSTPKERMLAGKIYIYEKRTESEIFQHLRSWVEYDPSPLFERQPFGLEVLLEQRAYLELTHIYSSPGATKPFVVVTAVQPVLTFKNATSPDNSSAALQATTILSGVFSLPQH